MTIGDRMRNLREQLGLSQDELAKSANTIKQTIYKYENNIIANIPSDKIEKIADRLNTSPSYLMGWEGDQNNNRFSEIIDKVPIPLYMLPVSAGTGEWLADGHEYSWQDIEDVPKGADFALRVRGDSMEPLYSDNDIVFIRQNVIVESGHVGVFFLNGEGYMKMLQGNKLISLNDKYEPIVINDFDSFLCAGRVVGKTKLER